MKSNLFIFFISILLCVVQSSFSQPNSDDYKRGLSVYRNYSGKILNTVNDGKWIENGNFFFYRTKTSDGNKYFKVSAVDGVKTEVTNKDEIEKFTKIDERGYSNRYWAEEDDELNGHPILSPDSTKEAFIKNYNLYIKDLKGNSEHQLTFDGSNGEYYSCYIQWSPDSENIALTKIRPAEKQYFYMIESSPNDQLQPKLHKREYRKPGAALPFKHPYIVNVSSGNILKSSTELFPNPFSIDYLRWNKDGSAITFRYNQRGHQVYRYLEMNAVDGSVRTLAEDVSPTFIVYTRIYQQDINDGKQFIWSSERDNYNHLYLYDTQKGKPIRQITKGEWYVRSVEDIDEKNNNLLFSANGISKNEDPYNIKYYRINFDGKNMKCLTPEEGNHHIVLSPDKKVFIDTYSTVNVAPKTVLRDASEGKIISLIESADITPLKNIGWKETEPFVAKGRDGKTDIWGIIIRPSNFDPNKKYPVLEYIYAGPGHHYVPKDFVDVNYFMHPMTELGFIVVQIDGMGTSYRSKSFEDVTYKNLYDAGLKDRMLWIKAAAEKYPYMDISRVGIYGGSAGGQNAMAATLQYPDFYKAAYSGCGCHDNRMDKIWWNEQWMGYPIDSQYVKCSNVENAKNLKTPLMLMVGELDDNVDPSSTMQVVNALIKADKDFELLFVPGVNHQLGNGWAEHKRMDFFVRNLYNIIPPKWNE
ncbi:MAG: DPP IV N-terminal domain-containing protein [Bacteroidales bacterium]|nr:DPP IV N-terminal domain-containing protein [Bacteroidales bacterium]